MGARKNAHGTWTDKLAEMRLQTCFRRRFFCRLGPSASPMAPERFEAQVSLYANERLGPMDVLKALRY